MWSTPARIDGASSWALLTQVELPMALPAVLGGLRNGVTLAVTGAIVGEMVMGGAGLGTVLTIQRDVGRHRRHVRHDLRALSDRLRSLCGHLALGAPLPHHQLPLKSGKKRR